MLRKFVMCFMVAVVAGTTVQFVFADVQELLKERIKQEAKAELDMPMVPFGEDGYVSNLYVSPRSTQTGSSCDYNKSSFKVDFSSFGSRRSIIGMQRQTNINVI